MAEEGRSGRRVREGQEIQEENGTMVSRQRRKNTDGSSGAQSMKQTSKHKTGTKTLQ